MGKLGGSQTQQTTVPAWLEAAGRQLLQRSDQASRTGYVPYTGPEVAAFTPMQDAAFAGTNQAASAFGMPTSQGNGMPPAQTFAGGMQGYSSMPLYNEAMAQMQSDRPGQYNAIQGMFVDPRTGQLQAAPAAAPAPAAAAPTSQTGGGRPRTSWNNHPNNPNNQGNGQLRPEIRPTAGRNPLSGYTGLRDMVNGGGPGASGGGLLSRIFGGRG